MAERTKPRHGDRAVNTRTGELGTIVDVHISGHLSVLPDTGPHACTTWPPGEFQWEADAQGRTCARCGSRGHRTTSCQGDWCRT